MSEKVFAFDIGTGSLGIAVRDGNEIINARSYLIPTEFASIKDQRERRRQYRTRISHKKREAWLKKVCQEAGIEILEGRIPRNKKKGIEYRRGDERLEREFAGPGDGTVYTSCLLRIFLLRGEKLEGWQVYKALHSAIQRRGFDPSVPWKRKTKKDKKTDANNEKKKNAVIDEDKDEKENKKKAQEYEKKLEEITHGREDRNYPCYFDAYRMKLWNPETDELRYVQTHEAERARSNEIAPSRQLVEKEFRDLVDAAAKQYPSLTGKADYIMYGPAKTSYASYHPDLRKQYGLKEGGEKDWHGALSQKIPRFDNRMPDKCALIPRYNVCRAHDHLAMQFTFLMKLKNMRFFDKEHHEQMLNPIDIKEIFDEKVQEAAKKKKECIEKGFSSRETADEIAKIYSINQRDWKKWLKNNKNGYPYGSYKKGEKPVESPKTGGRKRHCRPAMRIMCDLILSGESPWKYYSRMLEEIDNDDPRKGLVNEDIEFLLKLPDNWEGIYIPQYSLAEQYMEGEKSRDTAIQTLINKQRNPIIRHRMEIFKNYLDSLTETYGVPNKVVIELVRQDFSSEKAKKRFGAWQRENRKKAEEAKKEAEKHGENNYKNRLKIRLLKQQNYQCLYTGKNLSAANLSMLDVDHAVPQKGGYNGSDSMYNKVVTKSSTNREKSDKTPYEFITSRGEWHAFCERVNNISSTLGKKKAALLTAEHPEELDEKYTQLAETAWIARIARNIVCLQFGWQYGEKGEHEKALVVDGKLTANVRSRYRLNSLLSHGDEKDPIKIEEKCRDDKRHHALDAMVLSFITRNKPELPKDVHKERFREWLEKVIPEYIAFEKTKLGEMIYGKRTIDGEDIMVKRKKLSEIDTIKDAKSILDEKIRNQVIDFLSSSPTESELKSFFKKITQTEKRGSRVIKVTINEGNPKEYKDLSKNETLGQYRKGKQNHKGQFLYIDDKGRPKVRPVYVFESKYKVEKDLNLRGYQVKDFFESNCIVELQNDFHSNTRLIPAGKYILSTIKTNGQVILKNPDPSISKAIVISKLLEVGFHRVR